MNTKAKKTRAPNLNEEKIFEILQIIDHWDESRLTWNDLIHAIETRMQATYTRQALAKHQRIQVAYDTKNEILARATTKHRSTGIPRLDDALRIIDAQKSEIQRLKQVEKNFLEQFARWAINAAMAGIDTRLLDRPLESVDRDATEESNRKAKQPRKLRKG